MKVIYTLEQSNMDQPMIFLAGPTYRNAKTVMRDSWRHEAISLFKDENITLVVPQFKAGIKPDNWSFKKQIEWQTRYLVKSNLILFWIPREMKYLPGLTTNIEIGQWMHSGKIIVGAPTSAVRNEYLKQRLIKYEIPWYDKLSQLVNRAISMIHRPHKLWFTADTHFGQNRTLQLSKRPFVNIYEMNNTIISNWNKCVLPQDTICHLGDFGDAKIIKQLSGNIILIPGNYDTYVEINKLISQQPKLIVKKYPFNIVYDSIYLIHEPRNGMQKQKFYLYGHVHSLSKVKRNGLNVGTDCHNYSPIDYETIQFYYNAITKHYDENVFMEEIGI